MRDTVTIVGEPSYSAHGGIRMTFEFRRKADALKAFDELFGKDIDIEIKQHRESRTLTQNAYLHVLINKIARQVGASDDEIKTDMVLAYGVPRLDSNGDPAMMTVKDTVDVSGEYAKFDSDFYACGERYVRYILYKHTADMNTQEMNQLIDGVLFEAKELGIQTDTPEELDRLKGLWNDG